MIAGNAIARRFDAEAATLFELAGSRNWSCPGSAFSNAITSSEVDSNTSAHRAWVGSVTVLPMKKGFGAAPAAARAYSERPRTAG